MDQRKYIDLEGYRAIRAMYLARTYHTQVVEWLCSATGKAALGFLSANPNDVPNPKHMATLLSGAGNGGTVLCDNWFSGGSMYRQDLIPVDPVPTYLFPDMFLYWVTTVLDGMPPSLFLWPAGVSISDPIELVQDKPVARFGFIAYFSLLRVIANQRKMIPVTGKHKYAQKNSHKAWDWTFLPDESPWRQSARLEKLLAQADELVPVPAPMELPGWTHNQWLVPNITG
jgi:hypothetical protein